jgi:hypothetical protein
MLALVPRGETDDHDDEIGILDIVGARSAPDVRPLEASSYARIADALEGADAVFRIGKDTARAHVSCVYVGGEIEIGG